MTSPRLIYRKFTSEDLLYYRSWYCSHDVMKYINGQGLTIQEADERFEKALAINQQYPELGFFAVFKGDGTFVGVVKLVYSSSNIAEAGYGSLPEFWGRGYGVEMLAAIVHYARTIPVLTELMAIVNPDNTGSKKVLEKNRFEWYETRVLNDRPVEYYKLTL